MIPPFSHAEGQVSNGHGGGFEFSGDMLKPSGARIGNPSTAAGEQRIL
jgi:hypothetical protein